MNGIVLTALNNSTALNNASSDLTAAFGSSFGLFGPLAVVLLLVIGIFVGSSVARIAWVHEKLKLFSHTLYYAIVGGVTVAAAGIVAYPVWKLSQTDPQTKTLALKAIGVIVVGYAALSVVGYIIDRTVLENLGAYLEELDDEPDESEEEPDE